MEIDKIKEFNKIFYEVEAEIYDERHPEVLEGNQEWWNGIGENLLEPARNGEGLRVLDVGSGTGFVCHALAKYLKTPDQFICYDLSPAMLMEARKKLGTNGVCTISYYCGESETLPFKSGTFDLVTINALLHHLSDYEPLLKEAARILKKGGHVIIAHEPNKLFFASPVARLAASFYKMLGLGKTLTEEMRVLVNKELRNKGLADHDLSKDEILRLVEFNSPVEQSSIAVNKDKGLIPQELIDTYFPGYQIVELREYSTFFVRPIFDRIKWLGYLVKTFGSTFIGAGNLFSIICRK